MRPINARAEAFASKALVFIEPTKIIAKKNNEWIVVFIWYLHRSL
jgi:hypothetical protein